MLLYNNVQGIITLRDENKNMIAEVNKNYAEPVELALEPGKYIVTLDMTNKRFMSEVNLENFQVKEITTNDYVNYKKKFLLVEDEEPVENNNDNYVYPLKPYRLPLFISAGVMLAAGLYCDVLAKNDLLASHLAYNNYMNANRDFDIQWNSYINNYDSARSLTQWRNVLYVSSGIAAGYGIVSYFIKIPLNLNVDKNKAEISLKF